MLETVFRDNKDSQDWKPSYMDWDVKDIYRINHIVGYQKYTVRNAYV